MAILLTGGSGFIGSHTAVELLKQYDDVIILDNLSNSSEIVIEKIEKITSKKAKFYKCDATNKNEVEKIFEENDIDSVIHFSGYKAVGESVEKPLYYYRNNIDSTLTILEAMKKYDTKKFIFSSSATVYDFDNKIPYVETMSTGKCTNPYGFTKAMIEQILKDLSKSDNSFSIVILRYFNPIGAHESGLIGEKPNGIPNNLMPYITQTAQGIREKLNVFGNDYDTKDGTGVRDYIHVIDLAKAHVKALEYANKNSGIEIFNIGTGVGYSVLDIVNTFIRSTGINVPYTIAPRRVGDLAMYYADATKAEQKLEWKAEKTLEQMCEDSWRWQQNCK